MEGANSKDIDKAKRLLKQQEMVDKIVKWLREEGFNPQNQTDKVKDATYFARIVTKEGEKNPQGQVIGEEGFHVLLSKNHIDSVTISEVLELQHMDQEAYKSLGAKPEGILRQNRFYLDLQLALHQKNVFVEFEGGIRALKSMEISKGIFFDGLTKDRFFETYVTVDSAFHVARIKFRQLRDDTLPSQAGQTRNDSSDLR